MCRKKPGEENALAGLLEQATTMGHEEELTPLWFAVRFDPAAYAVFDAYPDETGVQAHLAGPIAAALMADADGDDAQSSTGSVARSAQ